jgi:Xaa-Pro dipeptidase
MDLNFSKQEFARRCKGIFRLLEPRGIDGLIVTSPPHIVYVVGDPVGFLRVAVHLGLTAVVLTPDSSALLVRNYEYDSAVALTAAARVVAYPSTDSPDPKDPAEHLAALLREVGLETGRIGVESVDEGLTPRDLASLRRLLPQADLVDASGIVDRVADVKSPEEIDVMREAARYTDVGFRAFTERIAKGVSEAGVAAAVLASMIDAGSEYPFYHPWVLFGPRTAWPHAGWSDYRLRPGDHAYIELGGSARHYQAPMMRTAICDSNQEVAKLYSVGYEAVQEAINTLRPGVTSGDVDAALRGVVDDAGRSESLRHRAGYSVGIDYAGRNALSLRPSGDELVEAGMTLFVFTILFERGSFAIAYGETVLVTEDVAETLSASSSDLVFV